MLLEKRFRELAERYAHRIPMWEVTNETLVWNRIRIGISEFFEQEDFVEWSFKTRVAHGPRARRLGRVHGVPRLPWDV